ncbi:MAG: hypothetical protein ACI85O_001812 [Saprospiraceae bacterium]|jgi:hypothetical protein
MQKHSHEISDILARPPRRLVAIGTVIAVVSFLAIIFLMWYISYPDQVDGRLSMTTTIPPISVISNASGHVTLKKQEGDFVIKGEELGYINDRENANVVHITSLEQMVNGFMEFEVDNYLSYKPADTFEVGEIQPFLDDFNETISSFKLQASNSSNKTKINKIKQKNENATASLAYFDEAIRQQVEKYEIVNDIGRKKAVAEYQKDFNLQNYNTFLEGLKDIELEITRLKSNKAKLKGEIDSGKYDILNERIEVSNGSKNRFQDIRRKLNALDNSITKWKSKYYLTAPADGKVTYYDEQLSQQLVRMGEEVMAVVPTHTEQDILGRVELPLIGSGKVEPGQRVLIKFDTYPFLEYGFVEGNVKTKSLLPTPEEEVYILTVELPNGLITSRGDTIAFRQNMLADAEIVTEEARLIERVFGSAFSIFKR